MSLITCRRWFLVWLVCACSCTWHKILVSELLAQSHTSFAMFACVWYKSGHAHTVNQCRHYRNKIIGVSLSKHSISISLSLSLSLSLSSPSFSFLPLISSCSASLRIPPLIISPPSIFTLDLFQHLACTAWLQPPNHLWWRVAWSHILR